MKLSSLFASGLMLLLASCTTTGMMHTASTLKTNSEIASLTIADLDVNPQRVTYTMVPTEDIQLGGEENVKRAAEAKLLESYDNADVLVDAQFIVSKESGSLFKKPKIKSVTVSGHPAHYKEFHSVPASVWNDAIAAVSTVGQSTNNDESRTTRHFANIPKPNLNFSGARFESYINAFGGYTVPKDAKFEDGIFHVGGSLTFGCRILPQLFIGVGAAGKYVFDSEFVYIPVYGNIRFYTHNGSISPFIDAKVGHSFVPGDKMYKGGFYASPTIGYAFGRFEIGIQYTFQKCRIEKYDYKSTDKEHSLSLSLGVRL